MSGKFGLEGGATSSVNPKFVECIEDLRALKVNAGNGHLCFVVDVPTDDDKKGKAALKACPLLQESGPLITAVPNVEGGATKRVGALSEKGDTVCSNVKRQKKV